jgi:hypothetical protein
MDLAAQCRGAQALQEASMFERKREAQETTPTEGLSAPPITLLTVVGDTAKIEGKFQIADSIQIECEVGGELQVGGKLIIGEKGVVNANVETVDAVIRGHYDGDMTATGNVEDVRKGFVTPDVFEQILHHLTEAGSEAVADVAEFAWLTASRRGSCFGVQWPDVARNEGLITFPAEIEKNGEPRQIPIVGQLHDLIEKRWKARKLGCEYVFHRNGRRIKAISASWASACHAAGVPGLLFHDLRRSAVRNMVKAGVREKVAMEISGHRTRSIFDRYTIVDNADKREALTVTQASTRSRGNVVPLRKEA